MSELLLQLPQNEIQPKPQFPRRIGSLATGLAAIGVLASGCGLHDVGDQDIVDCGSGPMTGSKTVFVPDQGRFDVADKTIRVGNQGDLYFDNNSYDNGDPSTQRPGKNKDGKPTDGYSFISAKRDHVAYDVVGEEDSFRGMYGMKITVSARCPIVTKED